MAILAGLALNALGQQSFFDVINSEMTPHKKVLAQWQVSLARQQIGNQLTFDYGLGRGWEIGLNINQLTYETKTARFLLNDTANAAAIAPELLLNAQKVFALNDRFNLGIGGQAGLDPASDRLFSTFIAFAYANLTGKFCHERVKTVTGFYSGNQHYLGRGSPLGVHIGVEAAILYQKIHFVGEYATGNNGLGHMAFGGQVFLAKSLPLLIGWRRARQDGQQSIIVELTYTPK